MHHPRPIHLHRRSGAHERHRYARRAWPAHIRIAAVVAGCLIAEAILAKNVINVTVNMVAFLAPVWVFAVSQAWPTKDRVFELATMLIAVAATAGVLIFYAL